jgi:epoxyqueuosine reductase
MANISVYAKNIDYHKVIKEKLEYFQKWLFVNYEIESKSFIDTSPILEKYFAQNANIGWQGKNTNLVSKKFGSWLFLSEIFLPIKLENDPSSSNNCGICNKCIDICPTKALYENYKIDSRKCISYLTIEHKGPFPLSLRKKIGNKIYGCDDCLAICPWNKFSKTTKNKDFLSTSKEKTLDSFLSMDEKNFKNYFKKSPILRIGWVSFLRNVIIASGNSKNRNLSKKIYKFLYDNNPIIRGASIWSLFQLIEKNQKKKIKEKFLKKEKNKYVLYELNISD